MPVKRRGQSPVKAIDLGQKMKKDAEILRGMEAVIEAFERIRPYGGVVIADKLEGAFPQNSEKFFQGAEDLLDVAIGQGGGQKGGGLLISWVLELMGKPEGVGGQIVDGIGSNKIVQGIFQESQLRRSP